MRDYIQPTIRQVGIEKKMSWHTFRHYPDVAQEQWGGCERCTGAVAAFNGRDDTRHLHAGVESAERAAQSKGGRHDQAKTKLYRRCTATFAPEQAIIELSSRAIAIT
jgi:hypothetical protein